MEHLAKDSPQSFGHFDWFLKKPKKPGFHHHFARRAKKSNLKTSIQIGRSRRGGVDGVIFMGLLTMCQFIGEGDGLRKGTHGEFELLLPFVEIKCTGRNFIPLD